MFKHPTQTPTLMAAATMIKYLLFDDPDIETLHVVWYRVEAYRSYHALFESAFLLILYRAQCNVLAVLSEPVIIIVLNALRHVLESPLPSLDYYLITVDRTFIKLPLLNEPALIIGAYLIYKGQRKWYWQFW